MPVELRATWLVEARQIAVVAGDLKQANAWQRDLDALTTQLQAEPR